MIQLGIVSPASAGLAPYQVQGDPVVALIAQVNRFAGRSLKIGTCGSRAYVPRAFPLNGGLTDAVTTAAALIIHDRYACVAVQIVNPQKLQWAIQGISDSIAFVSQNLDEITLTLAQVGDSLGLSPANVGITTVDPKLKPKSKLPYIVFGGSLLVAAIVAGLYMRKGRYATR